MNDGVRDEILALYGWIDGDKLQIQELRSMCDSSAGKFVKENPKLTNKDDGGWVIDCVKPGLQKASRT